MDVQGMQARNVSAKKNQAAHEKHASRMLENQRRINEEREKALSHKDKMNERTTESLKEGGKEYDKQTKLAKIKNDNTILTTNLETNAHSLTTVMHNMNQQETDIKTKVTTSQTNLAKYEESLTSGDIVLDYLKDKQENASTTLGESTDMSTTH